MRSDALFHLIYRLSRHGPTARRGIQRTEAELLHRFREEMKELHAAQSDVDRLAEAADALYYLVQAAQVGTGRPAPEERYLREVIQGAGYPLERIAQATVVKYTVRFLKNQGRKDIREENAWLNTLIEQGRVPREIVEWLERSLPDSLPGFCPRALKNGGPPNRETQEPVLPRSSWQGPIPSETDG